MKQYEWAQNKNGQSASKAHRTQNTYVDQLVVVSLPQVMQNRSVVKIGQVGHIFGFLVFWRIDLWEEIFLQIAGLRSFIGERERIWWLVTVRGDSHRSDACSSAAWDCVAQPPRSSTSGRPCPRTSRTWAGSLATSRPFSGFASDGCAPCFLFCSGGWRLCIVRVQHPTSLCKLGNYWIKMEKENKQQTIEFNVTPIDKLNQNNILIDSTKDRKRYSNLLW